MNQHDYHEHLTAVYDMWLKKNDYPSLSADELLHELYGRPRTDVAAALDRDWLEAFIVVWNQGY